MLKSKFSIFRENAVTFDDVASGVSFFQPDSFFNALTYVIGLSLFASAFLLFPLVERVTNAKQVQMMYVLITCFYKSWIF